MLCKINQHQFFYKLFYFSEILKNQKLSPRETALFLCTVLTVIGGYVFISLSKTKIAT